MKLPVYTVFVATFYHFLVGGIAHGASPDGPALNRRQENCSCENTATSRSCWGDYSIDTDWYSVIPETGVTREVWSLFAQCYSELTGRNTVLAFG